MIEMAGILFYTCIKDKFIKVSYLAPMEYYIILCFFFYILLELGVQNSSGILTDRVDTQWLLSKWDMGTNFIDQWRHPKTFKSRFLGESCAGEYVVGLEPPTLNLPVLLTET